MQVLERIRLCRALQVKRVTFTRGEGLLDMGYLMCNFFKALSVTSRRQFYPSLERRDVRFECHDVDFECLWNVATLISNVATLNFTPSGTSRREFPTSRR